MQGACGDRAEAQAPVNGTGTELLDGVAVAHFSILISAPTVRRARARESTRMRAARSDVCEEVSPQDLYWRGV